MTDDRHAMIQSLMRPLLRGLFWGLAVLVVVGLCFLTVSRLFPAWRTRAQQKPQATLPGTEPAARQDHWRTLGPGGGGAQFFPAVSPHDSNLVLVACDMGGGYVSENGGLSWREFNLRSAIRHFAFDPADPKVVYAAGDFLWRSEDRAMTWSLVYPDPQAVTAVTFPGDDEAITAMVTPQGGSSAVEAFAADPADSQVLYLAVGQSLHTSHDRGKHWALCAKLPGAARRIYVDPRPAAKGAARKVFLVGTNWTAVWDARKLMNAGRIPDVGGIRDSAVSFPASGGRAVVYVVADFQGQDGFLNGGLLRSRDEGSSWQPAYKSFLAMRATNSKSLPYLSAIAVPANNPKLIYLSYSALDLPGGHPAFGVAKSVNGATTWNLVWQQTGDPVENVADSWVSDVFGAEWAEDTQSIGIQETNPDIVFASDLARTMRSLDGGKTWAAVYSRKMPGGGAASTGLDVTSCYGIHFDPFNRHRQFLSCTDTGQFRSEDGGRSWTSSLKGVPRAWRNTTYWMEFDPKIQGRMWAAASGTHDLPRMKMFRRHSPSTFKGGVVRSDDGGQSWASSSRGLPEGAVTHLLLDPSSPPDHRVLYAAVFGQGVYKSADGGESWTRKDNGLIGAEPMAWRLAFDSDRTLYLVAIRRSEDGSSGNDRDGMLYRSIDGAESWRRIALPPGVNGPVGVAIDPSDARRLYVAAWANFDALEVNPPKRGGLWLSTDGGITWRNTNPADQYLYDVTVSPYDPQVLFAAGFQSSIWRSGDRGETWQRIRGFNFKTPFRVIPDPLDANMVYVATYGSSIWYGPAKGDPDAVEDIISPPAVRFSR